MIQRFPRLPWSPRTGGLTSAASLLAPLAAVGLAFALLSRAPEERVLSAWATAPTDDADFDGLVALQEEILGTSDLNPDTDGDLVDDVVELARGSDPLDANSIPTVQAVSVGMSGRCENGVITVFTAVYASLAELTNFDFDIGLSWNGAVLPLSPSLYLPASKITFHTNVDPTGWIIVLETTVPETMLQSTGYLGVYSTVMQGGSSAPSAAAVLNAFDFGGQSVHLLDAPSSMSSGFGSIYKPLAHPEDLPSSWVPGEICWQSTTQVGVVGPSIVLSVQSAACEPLDSSCSAVSCSNSIGQEIKILDAGALAGGS